MATHTAAIRWNRGAQQFTDNRYSRVHTWKFDGGTEVPASASPHVVPRPMSVDALPHAAHAECFIAASIRSEVVIEPRLA